MTFFIVVDDAWRDGPLFMPILGDVLNWIIGIGAILIFWLSVAHYINKVVEHYKRKPRPSTT